MPAQVLGQGNYSHEVGDKLDRDMTLPQLIVLLIAYVLLIADFASPDRLEILRLAALMHDLGKIGVRDDILLKPEELTEEERTRIQLHPVVAANILLPIHGAREIADIVLAHHECPDGSGYPQGRNEGHIPVEAHILHAADVLCSLTESRTYKEAWGEADALAMMKAEAGNKFEAESVRLLEETLGERHRQAT